jgi:endo-1,3(4)-beta-glucanase
MCTPFPLGTLCKPTLDTDPSDDIFTPIRTRFKVPDVIPQFPNHPVTPKGILDPPHLPIQTNKFYSNWLHGSQTCPVWTHPYALSVEQGWRPVQNWGMAVSHTEAWQVRYPEGEVPVRVSFSIFLCWNQKKGEMWC